MLAGFPGILNVFKEVDFFKLVKIFIYSTPVWMMNMARVVFVVRLIISSFAKSLQL